MLHCVPAKRRLALLALAAVGLLCACERQHLPPIGAAPAERAPMASVAEAAGTPLFVGRWAATSTACAAHGWALTAASLKSPSALTCTIAKAEPTPAGYTIYGACTAGKASQLTQLVFTLTGSGASRSLTLSGGPFSEPVALTHCSEKLESASNAPPASGAQDSSAPA